MLGQKKLVHRVQRTEGKRNIFHQLLEEYDIQTAVDILEALKDVLGETSEQAVEGEMDLDHQDRKSTFQPQVEKKREKDISDIDQKIIFMYDKGKATRQISETIEDIYGFEATEDFIFVVTGKIFP